MLGLRLRRPRVEGKRGKGRGVCACSVGSSSEDPTPGKGRGVCACSVCASEGLTPGAGGGVCACSACASEGPTPGQAGEGPRRTESCVPCTFCGVNT